MDEATFGSTHLLRQLVKHLYAELYSEQYSKMVVEIVTRRYVDAEVTPALTQWRKQYGVAMEFKTYIFV